MIFKIIIKAIQAVEKAVCMHVHLSELNTSLHCHVRFLLWSHEWRRAKCSLKSPPYYLLSLCYTYCPCWLEYVEGKQVSGLTDASRASVFQRRLKRGREMSNVC